MKAHSEEVRQVVLDRLKASRSLKEISDKVGIPVGTIEDWASDWRKSGELSTYIRPGMEFSNRAKIASKGYYPCIRKRYAGMRWTDKCEGRVFGFNNALESIPFYLDNSGKPMACAYCGEYPPVGKVWGLDRIDSNIGHTPGNVVPCCSYNKESSKLSCQLSKSKFSLYEWMSTNMARTFGKTPTFVEVCERLRPVYKLAKELKDRLQSTE